MSEEKRKILEMIESGKISASEGMKLLEALEETEYDEFVNENIFDDKEQPQEKEEDRQTEYNFNKEETGSNKNKKTKFEKNFDRFSDKFDKWDDKFSKRFSFLGEEIAKKTQVFSEKVLDKVEEILDGNPFDKFWENPDTKLTKEIIELPAENISDISLQALNGKLTLKESIDNIVKLEVEYAYKNNKETLVNEPFAYEVNENKLTFNPTMRDNITLNILASIPGKEFNKIALNSKNGKIDVKDVNSNILECNTKNSGIKIADSRVRQIVANTKNGKITLEDIKADKINLTTANSSINLDDINTMDIEAYSQNGQIVLNDIIAEKFLAKTTNASVKLSDCKLSQIDCDTSNGKIILSDISTVALKQLSLNTSNSSINTKFSNSNKYFKVDAATTQGTININIPNFEVTESNKTLQGNNNLSGKNYSDISDEDAIKVVVSTSNGNVNIQ